MINFFKRFKLSYVAAMVLAAVFIFSLISGIKNGKNLAHTESVLAMQSELQKGLNYFYQDQNRYPSVDEFSQKDILLNYFNTIPNQAAASSVCSQNFVYKKLATDSYQLDFCLDAPAAGYGQGWNTVVVNKNS